MLVLLLVFWLLVATTSIMFWFPSFEDYQVLLSSSNFLLIKNTFYILLLYTIWEEDWSMLSSSQKGKRTRSLDWKQHNWLAWNEGNMLSEFDSSDIYSDFSRNILIIFHRPLYLGISLAEHLSSLDLYSCQQFLMLNITKSLSWYFSSVT